MALQNAFANLATDKTVDETTTLLRRIVHLLESQATVDQQNRQRITLDSITGSLTLGTITTVGTVSNITTLAAENQRLFIDTARTAYNTGIRSKLIYS